MYRRLCCCYSLRRVGHCHCLLSLEVKRIHLQFIIVILHHQFKSICDKASVPSNIRPSKASLSGIISSIFVQARGPQLKDSMQQIWMKRDVMAESGAESQLQLYAEQKQMQRSTSKHDFPACRYEWAMKSLVQSHVKFWRFARDFGSF